jgi:hypothetical protein
MLFIMTATTFLVINFSFLVNYLPNIGEGGYPSRVWTDVSSGGRLDIELKVWGLVGWKPGARDALWCK